jgi:hypothetical protein
MADLVYVYRLLDPQVLANAADIIGPVLIPDRRIDQQRYQLSISPASGWLSFRDTTQLWQSERRGGLPPHPDAVETIVDRFVTQVEARAAASPAFRKLGAATLLPRERQKVGIYPIASTRFAGIDHWLYRATATLPLGPARHDAPIVGGTLDVRIGANGRVIGVSSHYRLLAAGAPITDIEVVPDAQTRRTTTGLPIGFLSVDEGCPQTFVSAYYILESSDGAFPWPACGYSLVADIGETATPTGSRLTAVAYTPDPAATYRYEWGAWRLDRPFPSSLAVTTDTTTLDLDTGVHNVILNVTNLSNGATSQVQRMVFSRGSAQTLVA